MWQTDVRQTDVRQHHRFMPRLLGAGHNKMHGALCALHVSLNNAAMRTVRKCLKMNNGHLILQIWIEWKYRVWGATHEAILKPSEAQNSFWNKNRTGQTDVRQHHRFPAGPMIKLSRVLQIVWQEYGNGDGRHSKHFSLLRKVFALTAFALSWIAETIPNC